MLALLVQRQRGCRRRWTTHPAGRCATPPPCPYLTDPLEYPSRTYIPTHGAPRTAPGQRTDLAAIRAIVLIWAGVGRVAIRHMIMAMSRPMGECVTRASGCLFGLAYGDALGKPTEFLTVAEIHDRYGTRGPGDLDDPALVTDDTQMTLAVGWALLEASSLCPELVEPALRARFLARAASPDNNRAPGHDLPACLRRTRPRCAVAGGDRTRVEGVRREHAGGAGRPGRWLRRGHPRRPGPQAPMAQILLGRVPTRLPVPTAPRTGRFPAITFTAAGSVD
jgi:hypothetical protein